MSDRIHICSDRCLGICSGAWPLTWPSGPAWDAFLDDLDQRARADERRKIEAEDAKRWQRVREVVHGVANPPRWARFPDVREAAYRDAEQAQRGRPVDLTKRTAA